MKFKVTMICKEIWRAETVVEVEQQFSDVALDMEAIKDEAWGKFDAICARDLEQENYTKVEEIKPMRFK